VLGNTPSELGDHIVGVLDDANRPLDVEALADELPADAARLEDALTDLQRDGRVLFHARLGGFVRSTWTFNSTCAECGDEIPDGEHYLMRVRHQRAEGTETRTIRLHASCADRYAAL